MIAPYEWEARWRSAHRAGPSMLIYNRTVRVCGCARFRRFHDRRRRGPEDDRIACVNARELGPGGEA
jgi:hypothetical protein